MTSKLPTYFREYLDERFGKVLDEIADVKQDVADLKKKVGSSDGKINKLWLNQVVTQYFLEQISNDKTIN